LFQKIIVEDIEFIIKRDDLIHPIINCNKFRKLKQLIDVNPKEIKEYISFGGAQSNLIVALSYLAKIQNKSFTYYTKELPKYLRANIKGNLEYALKNNMRLIEIKHQDYQNTISKLYHKKNSILIPQGGKDPIAQYGIKELADEIDSYIKDNNIKNPKIFLSSGTGTTALYLQKNLNYKVYTVACVGNSNYLIQQFNTLSNNTKHHPTILQPPLKYTFAKPHTNLLKRYYQLIDESGIEFDLIYDSVGWETVLNNKKLFATETIFIHQGGIMGNKTQLQRYNNFLT